jgi:hypothetical protein
MQRTLIGLVLVCGSAAFAADAVLTGDATVRNAQPSSNFGSLPQIEVSSGANGYVQFDLTGLPAGVTSANAGSAVLRLFVDKLSSPGMLLVGAAAFGWHEATITALGAPGGPPLASASVTSANAYISVDVTIIVRQWLDAPSSNSGFVLSAGNGAGFFLDSKESVSASQPPRLEINLVSMGPQGPAGPTGPDEPRGIQGPQGPAGTTGPQGPVGPAGPSGATGAQGPAGPSGPTGVIGPQGLKGQSGPAGPAGTQQGPTGPMGPVGPANLHWYLFDGTAPGLASPAAHFVVSCPAGWRAFSGACGHRDANDAASTLYVSYSGADPADEHMWHCYVRNDDLGSQAVRYGVLCSPN